MTENDSRSIARDVDVIVVGSGAAGMTAAIVAATEGMDVLLIEKHGRFGGSTMLSGGAVWIPNNHHQKGTEFEDSAEAALTYLRQTTLWDGREHLQAQFVEQGPRAIEYLERHSELKFRHRAYPDYFSELDGAAQGGQVSGGLRL